MVLKVCGITRPADALAAAAHGATAVGFVFWPPSPRYVDPGVAAAIVRDLPGNVTPVGVFVDATPDEVGETARRVGLGAVQLHGDERAADWVGLAWPLIRAVTLDGAAAAREAWPEETTLLVDAHDPVRRGGTGRAVDWPRAAEVARQGPVLLAGGLTPENVADAVAIVRPRGVDVSSGVEVAPGIKSEDRVARFLENARRAFEAIAGEQ